MTLKSFGCSFVFGSELADAERDFNAQPSQFTWPALLSKHLGHSYECHAKPGSGNLQILERVLTQASCSGSQDLFVIGWTWIDRFDYYNTDTADVLWRDWSTIMPADQTDLAKVYYKDLHSEYRDKFTSLAYVKLTMDTLEQKNIPFIMTYIDQLLFDQRWHTTPAVLDLQTQIRPAMTEFEGQTFLDFSKQKGFTISETLHPLEDAHKAAFELVRPIFDKQKTSDPVLWVPV